MCMCVCVCGQSKALIPLQTEAHPETKQRVLTNYMFPQQPRHDEGSPARVCVCALVCFRTCVGDRSQRDPHGNSVCVCSPDYQSDTDSFNPTLWEEQRQQRMTVAFEFEEKKEEEDNSGKVKVPPSSTTPTRTARAQHTPTHSYTHLHTPTPPPTHTTMTTPCGYMCLGDGSEYNHVCVCVWGGERSHCNGVCVCEPLKVEINLKRYPTPYPEDLKNMVKSVQGLVGKSGHQGGANTNSSGTNMEHLSKEQYEPPWPLPPKEVTHTHTLYTCTKHAHTTFTHTHTLGRIPTSPTTLSARTLSCFLSVCVCCASGFGKRHAGLQSGTASGAGIHPQLCYRHPHEERQGRSYRKLRGERQTHTHTHTHSLMASLVMCQV